MNVVQFPDDEQRFSREVNELAKSLQRVLNVYAKQHGDCVMLAALTMACAARLYKLRERDPQTADQLLKKLNALAQGMFT